MVLACAVGTRKGRLAMELRGWQQRYRVNNAAQTAFHTVDFLRTTSYISDAYVHF